MTLQKTAKAQTAGLVLSLMASVLPSSCRTGKKVEASVKTSADRNPLAAYEVVDCTPALCGGDVSVVNVNPTEEDLLAFQNKDLNTQYALDESDKVDDVSGSEAETAINKATVANQALRAAVAGSNGAKNSTVTATGMTGLFGGLSAVLSSAAQMNKFARENIEASSEDERAKAMAKVTSLVNEAKKLVKDEDKEKFREALPMLRILAGDDGWLNRGDLPRFLPVIPNVVGRVADEKISQGYAAGIADLARTRPFAYRRWVRAPNGIVGRVVQQNVDAELNNAYSQKWAAIRQASDSFQQSYNKLMTDHGITSYYMNVTDGKNYYDPAKPIDEEQIDSLMRVMSGRSLQEIVRQAASNPSNPEMPGMELGAMASLLGSIELPNGVPIADIDQLLKDSDGFTKLSLPKGLTFKLLENGRLEIKKFKSEPTDSSTSADAQKQGGSSQPGSNDNVDVVCTAKTSLDRNRNVMVYLYSSVEATDIQLKTGGGFYSMPWQMDPQNGWPTIKGGYAHVSWRRLTKAPMRITLTNGKPYDCTATLQHL